MTEEKARSGNYFEADPVSDEEAAENRANLESDHPKIQKITKEKMPLKTEDSMRVESRQQAKVAVGIVAGNSSEESTTQEEVPEPGSYDYYAWLSKQPKHKF
jgi:hypothetical protein